MNEFIANNEEETMRIGEEFSQKLKPHDVVFLIGDLGAGKTTFTKGVAKGLGVTSRVISPTFVIVRTHSTTSNIKTFYHLDLYRLASEKDVLGIDIKDILADETGVIFIEWPEKAKPFVDSNYYTVKIETRDDLSRAITIQHE